ncbi:maleylpyruvate isomerase family mycothiol-dependent enzyme [Streptomyces sp. NPDC059373]
MTTPLNPQTDVRPELLQAIRDTAAETARTLRSGTDTTVPIPGAEWTVGEAAAHLVVANELMATLAAGHEQSYGDGTAASLAAANAESLAGYAERDATVLAEGIVRHAQAFADAAARRPAAEPTVTPLGPMDLGTLAAYLLTHMMGHGYDIAVALRQPHMVDRERVELALPFLMTGMSRIVDARAAAGFSARYRLRLRGGSRFAVTFTEGVVTVSAEPPGRIDCTIMLEPVAFFLLALGRCSRASVIARGKIVAWGRKPWLAPRFPGFFTAP